MPRGVKRTEIEVIQADIAAAEKKRDQNLQAAADAKKAITQLQNKIDQQLAKEIAKACRTAGIPLKEVLIWVQARQAENLAAAPAAAPDAAPAKRRSPAKKAAPASPRGRKPKAAAKPKKAAPGRKPRKPAAEKPVEGAAEQAATESPKVEI